MADNKKYYYMRLKENFFDSDEMIILENLDNGDGIVYSNILLKLYLRSLKNDGKLMFNERIPFNSQMLSTIVRQSVGVVEKALKVFVELGLVEIMDNGAIYMLDIQKFIGKTSTEADRKRIYREKIAAEKGILQTKGQMSGQTSDKRTPELELEKELDIELDIESESEIENDADSDYKKITDFYQSNFGVITQLISQDISFNLKDYGYDLVHESMKRAIFRQKQYAYSVQILKSWSKNNIKTLEDVEADDNKFSRNKTTGTDDKSDWTWAEKKAGFREV